MDLEERLLEFDRAIVSEPDNPAHYIAKADFLQEQDQERSALEMLDVCARKFPNTKTIHAKRGAILLRHRAYLDACLSLVDEIAIDPLNTHLAEGIMKIFIEPSKNNHIEAREAASIPDYPKSLKYFMDALQLFPYDSRNFIAASFLAQKLEDKESQEFLDRIASFGSLNPSALTSDPNYRMVADTAHFLSTDPQHGSEVYELALKLQPENQYLKTRYAMHLLDQFEYKKVLETLEGVSLGFKDLTPKETDHEANLIQLTNLKKFINTSKTSDWNIPGEIAQLVRGLAIYGIRGKNRTNFEEEFGQIFSRTEPYERDHLFLYRYMNMHLARADYKRGDFISALDHAAQVNFTDDDEGYLTDLNISKIVAPLEAGSFVLGNSSLSGRMRTELGECLENNLLRQEGKESPIMEGRAVNMAEVLTIYQTIAQRLINKKSTTTDTEIVTALFSKTVKEFEEKIGELAIHDESTERIEEQSFAIAQALEFFMSTNGENEEEVRNEIGKCLQDTGITFSLSTKSFSVSSEILNINYTKEEVEGSKRVNKIRRTFTEADGTPILPSSPLSHFDKSLNIRRENKSDEHTILKQFTTQEDVEQSAMFLQEAKHLAEIGTPELFYITRSHNPFIMCMGEIEGPTLETLSQLNEKTVPEWIKKRLFQKHAQDCAKLSFLNFERRFKSAKTPSYSFILSRMGIETDELASRLQQATQWLMRDGSLFNAKIDLAILTGIRGSEDEQLNSLGTMEENDENQYHVFKSLYQIDFEKCDRKTLICDDLVMILDTPGMNISDRTANLTYTTFLETIPEKAKEQGIETYHLAGIYRNLRQVWHHATGELHSPNPQTAIKHHLKNALLHIGSEHETAEGAYKRELEQIHDALPKLAIQWANT